jgi:3-(3-hydroxy-phenyl)propionate hydroxylase
VTIVIVGARPIGLMSASLLGRLGVDTLFIERNAAPYDVPRAITLDDEGARTLQAAGLDQAYLPNARRGWGSRYYDDDGQAFAEATIEAFNRLCWKSGENTASATALNTPKTP